eukprot:Platyproteum_vivax@DN9282_c0_g1_i1.p1
MAIPLFTLRISSDDMAEMSLACLSLHPQCVLLCCSSGDEHIVMGSIDEDETRLYIPLSYTIPMVEPMETVWSVAVCCGLTWTHESGIAIVYKIAPFAMLVTKGTN